MTTRSFPERIVLRKEMDNATAAQKIVTSLLDRNGRQHFEGLSEDSGKRKAEAWRKSISVDNASTIMSWKRVESCAVVIRFYYPRSQGCRTAK